MRHWTLVTITLALAFGRTAAAPAQAAEAPAANAALKYWMAMALMPTLDKDGEALLADWDKVPLNGPALALVAASEDSLRLMRRGAKIGRCDWGLDFDDGPGLLLPYMARARDLARLAALHARREFEQGRYDEGAEDATAILALGRHVGSDPMMIAILVRYLIEGTAVDLLATYLPELGPRGARIVATLDALPPGATFEQAYATMEKERTVRWLLDRLTEAEARKKGAWRDVWTKVFDQPESREAAAQVDTYDRAVALTAQLLTVCDQLAALVSLPEDEFSARYAALKAKVKATNPIAGHLLTGPDRVRGIRLRNEVRVTMLRAAVAVVPGGPEALKVFKDPAGDGPFAYRALDGGFELKSKMIDRDRPVTLTFGRPKTR